MLVNTRSCMGLRHGRLFDRRVEILGGLGALVVLCAALVVFPIGSGTGVALGADDVLNGDAVIEADVVVYGGTSAAVAAAVQAGRMGKTAVIVSPEMHLGGLSSSGLGATDSGDKAVIGGLAKEFYHRLWLHYQNDGAWVWETKPSVDKDESGKVQGHNFAGMYNATQTMWGFEPKVAEEIFDEFAGEPGIQVFRGESLDREKGVEKEDGVIRSITVLSGKRFAGRMFIDATYEGDLLAASGVSYTVGRDGNDRYGETLDGIQTAQNKYHNFKGSVDPYVVPGDPSSGLLPMVNPDAGGEDGSGDRKVQAYCYRLCLTDIRENQIPFEKPEGYDERDYELLFRSIKTGQKSFCTFSRMPNHKTDTNNNDAVSTDFIGQNYDYPEAPYERRTEILAAHVRWQKGLFWTLANHPRVPEAIRAEFSRWGLAKDEFSDNGGWPYCIYVREGRRMVSDFVQSERHVSHLEPVAHSVGMGSYNMDSHNCQRYVDVDGNGNVRVRNEGDVEVSPRGAYSIDYGALVPKKSECANLLVPVCVSSSHIAFGSIRMEPVFMILGQSAATAAVLSMNRGIAPQDLPYEVLKERLLRDGQVLEKEGE